ncbi:hypothetical protein E4U53_007309 [Claviceps sorghi]|nr:hypothetical protein E4U53_007309 [Claviceps sorghi]
MGKVELEEDSSKRPIDQMTIAEEVDSVSVILRLACEVISHPTSRLWICLVTSVLKQIEHLGEVWCKETNHFDIVQSQLVTQLQLDSDSPSDDLLTTGKHPELKGVAEGEENEKDFFDFVDRCEVVFSDATQARPEVICNVL